MKMTMHGALVSIYGRGVLLTGNPGIGKSHLAFKLIQKGHALVADDIVLLKNHHDALMGFSPKRLRGILFRRGQSSPDEIDSHLVLRTCEIHWVAHLVNRESLLQTYAKAPTIDSQYLLGKIIPEVILPRQPLKLLAKKLEHITKKVSLSTNLNRSH